MTNVSTNKLFPEAPEMEISLGKLLPEVEIPENIMEKCNLAFDVAKLHLFKTPNAMFFISCLYSLKHKFTYEVPTAATDTEWVLYNPEFYLSLTTPERIFLMLHETLHVAYFHMARKQTRDHQLWNTACDYVINDMLIDAGFKMPKGGLHDKIYEGMSAEQVYDKLLEESKEDGGSGQSSPQYDDLMPVGSYGKAQGQDPSDEEGNAEGGKTLAPATAEDLSKAQERIDDMLVRAATASQMNGDKAGSIPGDFAKHIDSLLNPKMPWNRILRKYLTAFKKDDFSYRRINRRFFPEFYIPSLQNEAMGEIAVAIDVSGSVSKEQFRHFVSETGAILKMLKPEKLTLISFDTEIKQEDVLKDFRDIYNVKFRTGGGTCIRPVVKWANEHKPKILILFTDGYFDMPRKLIDKNTHVFWIINDNDYFEAPYGKVITYEF